MLMRRELHFDGRVVSCYKDRPTNIWDMVSRAMVETPDAEAIIDGDRRITYGEFQRIVVNLAANFIELGIGHGDRVATLIGNRADFIFVMIACARLGAVVVPLGVRLRTPEIQFICANSGSSILIHEASLEPSLPAGQDVPALRHRFAVGGSCAGSRDFSELLVPASRDSWPSVAEEDVFCISYTSGTTGKPKGALLTHLGMVHACLNYRAVLGLSGPETAVLATPGNHVGGAGIVMPILDLGGRIVLMWEFKARKFLEVAQAEKMTYGGGVPAMFNLMLLDPDFHRFDLSSWRWAFYSAAPMPEATIRAFAAALPDLTLINCYGSTEATSAITMMPPGMGLVRSESVGRAVPVVDVIVVDDDGRELPPGEPGEILVGGPTVVPGYWNDPAATANAFVGGYWRSGDIGSMTAEGFCRIHDRKKDMINRGGLKIFSAEVENVLSDHPLIVEAAVVGKPDTVLGERVQAFVVASSAELAEADVIAFCAARLADYKVPEIVTLMSTPLPRNPNGKIFRPALVEAAGQ